MMSTSMEDQFYSALASQGWSSPALARFTYYLQYLFNGVQLDGAAILDVGAGSGLYSFHGVSRGARRAVCLEPEGAGASQHVDEQFQHFQRVMATDRVSMRPVPLQAFDPEGEAFDVILLHNAINHLDESACVSLLHDEAAREKYRALFSRLHEVASPGATILITDCTPRNFFHWIGIRNPLAPTIEWHKHQPPAVWISLLTESGFKAPEVRWTPFNRFGAFGRKLTGNSLAAFFLAGHFRLTMRA